MRFWRVTTLLFLCALLLAWGRYQPASAHAKGTTPAPDKGYAGVEICTGCHENKLKGFEHSLHGKKTDPRTPAAQHACESCHGAAQAHAEGSAKHPPNVFGPKSSLTPRQQNEACLQCHATSQKHVHWQGSVHETRNVTCVSCHEIHGSNPRLLARPTQTELCGKCHVRQKAETAMSFHHPIREGQMDCSDCHNPHGTVGDKLITTATVNEKCFQCHADKRGPFVWNHAPAVENCLNCHNPHGSRHDYLLTARGPWLCQQCHNGEGHQGILYTGNMFNATANATSVYNTRPQLYNRSCVQCHQAIHGSQSPSGNTFLR